MMKSPLVLRARLTSSLKLCEPLHSPPASTGKSRVLINNLPYDLEERELNGIISKYLGASFPSVTLSKDRNSGKSRGFALAHFENKEEADTAASALSTLIVHERSISAHTSDFVDGTRPPKPYPQETTCFIGNLAFTTSEESIKALCHHHLGKSAIKRVKLIANPDSGESRGFGYIEFSTVEDATRALKELQGLELQGRDIRLDVPRDKASQQRQVQGQGPGHGQGQVHSHEKNGASRPASTSQQASVFIGNLSFEVDEQTLQEMLTDVVGENAFQRVHLARDRETGRPRGFAHVTFPDVEAAKRAIQELDGLEMIDRPLRVDMAVGLKSRASL